MDRAAVPGSDNLANAHAGPGEQQPSMLVVQNSPDNQQIGKGHGWPSMLNDERPMQRAMVLDGAVMPFLPHNVISIEEVDAHGLLNVGFKTGSSPIRQGDVVEEGNYCHLFVYIQIKVNACINAVIRCASFIR
jgi:hypothetical protein